MENKKVLCANRPVAFDLFPLILAVSQLLCLPRCGRIRDRAKPVSTISTPSATDSVARPQKPSLGIVGGGAGGVELALAMQSHLHQVPKPPNSH